MTDMLTTILSSLGVVVLLGLGGLVLTRTTEAVFGLRFRILRKGLAAVFFQTRKPHAPESTAEADLQFYCRNDAERVLNRCEPATNGLWERLGRIFASSIAPLDRQFMSDSIRELFPDLKPVAPIVVNRFARLSANLKGRLQRTSQSLTLLWAVVITLIYYRLPAGYWYTDGGEPSITAAGLAASILPDTAGDGIGAQVATVGITAIIVAVVANLLGSMRGGPGELVTGAELDESPRSDAEERGTIGRANCAVRAINFAGGGFDSIMQLGVTHALMTIQGRAPDAVVGLSTGAISAAALAEVLQAGEEAEAAHAGTMWKNLSEAEQVALQTARLEARVQRFREFENAAYQARERLYDAMTPDAYQIDSNDPLVPLETPFFQSGERAQRVESLSTKSGLIRLYNEFMKLNIPFGTIVRLLRRVLGILAAAEFPKFWVRWSVRILEFQRIWLLIGSNLAGVARLIPVLVRPLFRSGANVRPLSAGSLIFRFPINDRVLPALTHALVFVFLLIFWLGGSLLPLAPGLVVLLPVFWENPWAWSISAFYLIVGALALFATYKFDAIHFSAAFRDNVRAIVQFLWLVVKDLASLALILAGVRLLYQLVTYLVARYRGDSFLVESAGQFASSVGLWTLGLVAIGGLLFFLLLIVIAASIAIANFNAFRKQVRERRSFGSRYLQRFLKSYNLDRSLFHPYDLRSLLIELFDGTFYGGTRFSEVVSDSLKYENKRSRSHPTQKKTVADYHADHHPSPIHVGIAAANVLTGNLETISDKESVVKSIEAAMAVVPIFPAMEIGGSIYVDGTNVANVPTRALTTFLRDRINKQSGAVQIYSVSPLPISQKMLPDKEQGPEPYVHLWDIVKRALSLQQFRDAQLEQKLTEFYTMVIPNKNEQGQPQNQVQVPHESGPKTFNRAWVTPIEPSEPLNLNKRILFASKEEARKVVAQTIADGCRASLEMMIRPSIKARKKQKKKLRCKRIVAMHLEAQADSADLEAKTSTLRLPGSDGNLGPGLREICEQCALNRDAGKKKDRKQGYLELKKVEVKRAAWPHERATSDQSRDDEKGDEERAQKLREQLRKQYASLKNWPKDQGQAPGSAATGTRPTINLLFSGGVFRGVYQMGVLNALNELRVQPDLIAGASIGSITAAMVARVFSMEQDKDQTTDLNAISKPLCYRQIARLSAVYLAVDRVILTDRFSDFVRNLTIRASRIGFSMRQADHFFRKYDHPRSGEFEKLARTVLAGLERVFYLNPYQLNQLVRSIRDEDDAAFVDGLREYAQQWLQHMNVGVETLGAEPLRQLIEHFVIPQKHKQHPESTPFDVFSENSMQFLATATNLTHGKLEIIGDAPELENHDSSETMLMEALLVSSAFPGVFRPRWSWDLRPQTSRKAQYIDGGVMDNLPIAPVFDFLTGAVAAGHVTGRPTNPDGTNAPHLMFAASLEAETPDLVYRDEWESFKNYWPALSKRTKELKYNTKADIYRKAERNLRAIYESSPRDSSGAAMHVLAEPIDVEAITVIPKWLCGTFGFHPMLNFRRKRQAMSIAHGCATTLLRFANIEDEYLTGWGIDKRRLPLHKTIGEAAADWETRKKEAQAGSCWLRPGIRCPYAEPQLDALNTELTKRDDEDLIDDTTTRELASIYKYCTKLTTHQP